MKDFNDAMFRAASRFRLREREIGEFARIRGRGMRFRVRAFEAPGAGGLCLIETRAFAGLMKMETAVFSPTGLDGPLLSMDAISAFGRDTLILELYDTTLSHPGFGALGEVLGCYSFLPDYAPGRHWYDALRLPVSAYKRCRGRGDELALFAQDYAEKYCMLLAHCQVCDESEKRLRNAAFTDGLLKNGGPAVDQFRKMIGEEKAAEFLRRVMFLA